MKLVTLIRWRTTETTVRGRGTRKHAGKWAHSMRPCSLCWAPTSPLIAPWGYIRTRSPPPSPFFSRLPPGPLPGHSAAALHRVPSHARRCKKELYRKPTAHSGAARRNPSCGAVAAACTAADFGPQAFRHLAFTTHALQPGSLVHRRRGGLVRPGAGEAAAVKRTLPPRHSSSLFT